MEKVRIGVVGGYRGSSMINYCKRADNAEIVAICDNNPTVLEAQKQFAEGLDIAFYDNFEDFIKHDMDAVVLANYFHEHAPYAIKCFEKGIHVFSECISNGTMAEGVELIRAFEKSNSIYMLAENYPQMKFNREIKRVCEGGTLGKILYAEGEYNHPANPYDSRFMKDFIYFENI